MRPVISRFAWHIAPDVRHVGEAAKVLNVSSSRYFGSRTVFWYERGLRQPVLKAAFADYLLREEVPSWVRDYCRRLLNLAAVGQLDPRDFGVDHTAITRLPVIDRLCTTLVTLLAFFVYLFFPA